MDIAALRTFLCILDEGSFAAAARHLSISKSQCSKHISALESDLGARLLTRTTRAVTPTTIGAAYGDRVRRIIEQLDAAGEAVKAASDRPSGKLKIGSPIFYTLDVLQPHLIRFMDTHPEIHLELILDDNRVDLIAGGFDAVIRIGRLEDSGTHARKLQDTRFYLVASPEYIATHGQPTEPAQLMAHRCLHYANMRGAGTWPFLNGPDTIHQRVQIEFSTNNPEMIKSLALSGKGVALMPHFEIAEALADGRLIVLMPDYSLPTLPVNLIYPTRRLMTAALRSFIDFIGSLKLEE